MSAANPTVLFFDAAPKLTENGYRVVPIIFGRKKPSVGKRWQDYVYKLGDAKRYRTHGVGILCGEAIGVDNDVRLESLAQQIDALFVGMFGEAPRRLGLAPKFLRLMRAEVPFTKHSTHGYHFPGDGPEDKPHRVEILADGQQFVAYNIHEDTGKPYEWNGAGDPLTVRLADLPAITEAQALAFLAEAEKMIAAHPGARPEGKLTHADETRAHEPNEELRASEPERLRQALAAIPNQDLDYYEWLRVLYATKGALGSTGLEAFLHWSAQSAKDRPAYSAEQYGYAKPRKLGAGTVYYLAGLNGWKRTRKLKGDGSAPQPASAPDKAEARQTVPVAEASKPVIEVRAGEMPRIVTEAQEALLAAEAGIYQRSGQLVRVLELPRTVKRDGVERVAGSLVIEPVTQDYLSCGLAASARFEKFDRRDKKTRAIDPPPAVSATLLALTGGWKFPVLVGVVAAPTLRPDGSLLDRPGYDTTTGLYAHFDPANFPAINPRPSRHDALAALYLLRDLFSEFSFVGGPVSAQASAAIAATVTAAVRQSLEIAPLFGVKAPKASCGKTTLAKVAARVCTGCDPPAMTPPDDEPEFRKGLLGILMAGDACALIDNLAKPVKSAALCAAITSPTYRDRLMGVNSTVTVSTAVTWILTGNGLQFVGDLTTRALLIGIDPQLERPEERQFQRNLPAYIAEHRGKLLAATLAIPLAYVAAGEPKLTAPHSRFAEWDRLVRRPLLWLGVADPMETQAELRTSDPERENLLGVLHLWKTAFGEDPTTVAVAIRSATEQKEQSRPDLYDALRAVAGEKSGGGINNERLGRYLKAHAHRIEAGLQIEVMPRDRLTKGLCYRVVGGSGRSGGFSINTQENGGNKNGNSLRAAGATSGSSESSGGPGCPRCGGEGREWCQGPPSSTQVNGDKHDDEETVQRGARRGHLGRRAAGEQGQER